MAPLRDLQAVVFDAGETLLLIDREAIVNEIYYGEALATDNQIPAGYMGYRQPLLKYPKNGDLKKAKELMAQADVDGALVGGASLEPEEFARIVQYRLLEA